MKRYAKAVCLCLAACLLVLPSGGSVRAAGGNEFCQDYVYLWNTLRENYPYFSCLEAMGIDTERMEQDYAHKVPECQSLDAFVRLISDMFYRMNNFAHLAVVTPDAYYEYRNLADQGVLNPAYRDLICDTGTLKAYDSLSQGPREAANDPPLPEVRYYEEEQALYFRFQTFRHAYIERDCSVVNGAMSRYPDAEHIIIDIAGNRGGSDYYWIENIVAPFGGRYRYENILYFKDTPLTRAFGLLEDAVELNAIEEIHAIPETVRELNLTHAHISDVCFPGSENAETDRAKLKRWVLIDGGVYSAADSFAAFCKETGWASLIGEQTMGDGGGAAPLLVQLPETKILVQFSCATTVNSDGSLNAAVGTVPDYRPKPKETALEACLRLIDANE